MGELKFLSVCFNFLKFPANFGRLTIWPRLHLLGFIVTPLVFSIIFYLSNGKYHISYIDSLFLCVTSMTVCGLATVNLSTLTGTLHFNHKSKFDLKHRE